MENSVGKRTTFGHLLARAKLDEIDSQTEEPLIRWMGNIWQTLTSQARINALPLPWPFHFFSNVLIEMQAISYNPMCFLVGVSHIARQLVPLAEKNSFIITLFSYLLASILGSSFKNENGIGRSSPGCSEHTLKSIVDPSKRGGVPVEWDSN